MVQYQVLGWKTKWTQVGGIEDINKQGGYIDEIQ